MVFLNVKLQIGNFPPMIKEAQFEKLEEGHYANLYDIHFESNGSGILDHYYVKIFDDWFEGDLCSQPVVDSKDRIVISKGNIKIKNQLENINGNHS